MSMDSIFAAVMALLVPAGWIVAALLFVAARSLAHEANELQRNVWDLERNVRDLERNVVSLELELNTHRTYADMYKKFWLEATQRSNALYVSDQKFVQSSTNTVVPVASDAKPKKAREKLFKRKAIPNHIRLNVFEKFNYACAMCGKGKDEIPLQIDHIFPVSLGGTNDENNLQALCWKCNGIKGARVMQVAS